MLLNEHRLKFAIIAWWVLLIALGWFYLSRSGITPGELAQLMRTLLLETWYGPLIYLALYLIRPVLLFPVKVPT